jgi:hypothetical protein
MRMLCVCKPERGHGMSGERLQRLPIVRRTCHRPAARLSANLSGEIGTQAGTRQAVRR